MEERERSSSIIKMRPRDGLSPHQCVRPPSRISAGMSQVLSTRPRRRVQIRTVAAVMRCTLGQLFILGRGVVEGQGEAHFEATTGEVLGPDLAAMSFDNPL